MVLAAVAAGLIAIAIVRVLEGTLDLNELTERFLVAAPEPPLTDHGLFSITERK